MQYFDICSLMPTASGLKHVAMLSMIATYLRNNNVNFVGSMLSIIYDNRLCMASTHLPYVMTVTVGYSEKLNTQNVSHTRAVQTPKSTN
jgi:hypothetical protein